MLSVVNVSDSRCLIDCSMLLPLHTMSASKAVYIMWMHLIMLMKLPLKTQWQWATLLVPNVGSQFCFIFSSRSFLTSKVKYNVSMTFSIISYPTEPPRPFVDLPMCLSAYLFVLSANHSYVLDIEEMPFCSSFLSCDCI